MLMNEHLDYPEDEHQSRVMCGDPKALAWEWINAYAKNLSRDPDDGGDDWYGSGTVTANELIETAMNNLDTTSGWGDYISKGPLLEGVNVDPTFWDKLAILKDLQIPQDKRNDFFSCSC